MSFASWIFTTCTIENLKPSFPVGPIDQDLTVKTASPQQRRSRISGRLVRRKQNDPDAGIEAIMLGKKLIERLFLLVEHAECSRTRLRPKHRVRQ